MKTQSKRYSPKGGAGVPKRARRGDRPPAPAPKTHAIVKPEQFTLAEKVEKVLIGGDLAPLTTEERVSYYKTVCKSLGLNPLTKPFEYIAYNGKLQLYATRNCTDQLRKIHGISVTKLTTSQTETTSTAQVEVKDRTGRTDAATSQVWIQPLKGLELCNALMKTETKAKRRATLSICGLSFLDEAELDGLDDYNEVTPGGRIIIEQGSSEAAQEVGAKKIEELKEKLAQKVEPPVLIWTWFDASQTAQISGEKEVLSANKDLLGKHWNPTAQAIVVDGETLENLKFQFERRGVNFRRQEAA